MRSVAVAVVMIVVASTVLRAHNGPPFPILQDQIAGAYRVSLWTDPDTTDDQSAGGQFWVRLAPARAAGALPAETRARVVVNPVDRPGPEHGQAATPVNGDLTNQFAAVVLDHEGRFAVHVAITGPLGDAAIDSEVMATYNLRPPVLLLLLYVAPFIAIGVLWLRVVSRRRAIAAGSVSAKPDVPSR
jgi:hypothetical protein